ncbi:hypothetical protein SUGI_0525420 [Cryptomeria japonica]|uniref:sodium/hydrogen exchanger 4 n=1 Tax=Cryptomeria japonica TaxID=3369 RepID=UPI002408DFAA|nr:sodium/hydrogen exchanger 4 [Cryptomeria japonica]GLJ26876.1 hypothetical protein SUGI_0525420 [Cryptomeria japonica]
MVAIDSGAFESLLAETGLLNETGGGHLRVVAFSVFVSVLCACIVVGHLFEENRWVNESINALVIGIFSGFVVLLFSKGTNSHILRFDEDFFFLYLLPPIIFNAGFQVKKKQFFRNFIAIMLFGVVGVFISFAIISAGCWLLFPKLGISGLTIRDYLALGTIFSSTDTVCTLQVLHQDETPLLYSLVFGEGVVNDATSVVLFRAVQKFSVTEAEGLTVLHIGADFLYLFFTSTILGVATGLLTAYAIKSLYFGRHSTDREIALMALMAYLSYMLAELLLLSGILTVFFCGIVMSHYTWHNVTESSRITTKHTFATLSFISETFIFLYVGMDALDMEKWRMSKSSPGTFIGIFSSVMLLVLLGRAAFVFPLSALSNYLQRGTRNTRITLKHQVVIWWAGLMRGAVSIALAFNQFATSGISWNPTDATMITSTIIVVLFSTVVFGILTKPLIGWIMPHSMRSIDVSDPPTPKDVAFEAELGLPLLSQDDPSQGNAIRRRSSLSLLLERPTHTIHYLWRKFDDSYMRPVFGGRGFVPYVCDSFKEGEPSESSNG